MAGRRLKTYAPLSRPIANGIRPLCESGISMLCLCMAQHGRLIIRELDLTTVRVWDAMVLEGTRSSRSVFDEQIYRHLIFRCSRLFSEAIFIDFHRFNSISDVTCKKKKNLKYLSHSPRFGMAHVS